MLLLLSFLTLVPGESATVKCHDSHSCTQQYLSVSDNTIECFGDHSCVDASLIVDTTPSAQSNYAINCFGAHSCYNTSIIAISSTLNYSLQYYNNNYTNLEAYKDQISINCFGLKSCAMSKNISLFVNYYDYMDESRNVLRCHSEGSCFGSTIYTTDETEIYGYGYYDLANATIIGNGNFARFSTTGHRSACNTKFVSNGDDNYYQFIGTNSGYNATILCNYNKTCTIVCYHNACNNVSLKCFNENGTVQDYNSNYNYNTDNGNDSCVFDINCGSGSYKSDVCPNGYDYELEIDNINNLRSVPMDNIHNNNNNIVNDIVYPIPNLIDDLSKKYNRYDRYSTDDDTSCGGIACDNYLECDIASREYNATICCTGTNSCWLEVELEENNAITRISDHNVDSKTNMNNNTSYSMSLHCDAHESCEPITPPTTTTNVFESIIEIEGDVYMTAQSTLASDTSVTITCSNSSNSNNSIHNNNKECDIFCTGRGSCPGKSLLNGKNVYCLAQFSCVDSSIDNFNGNVWICTYFAGLRISVNNINDSVYCDGEGSCMKSWINNINRDVYASGAYSLYGARISNVGQSLFGFGLSSLSRANIKNVENVICSGKYSCKDSRMMNIEYLIANDEYSLANATVEIGSSNINRDGISNLNSRGMSTRNISSSSTLNATIIINGQNNESFLINCSNSDVFCHIICQSQFACHGMQLFCHDFGNISNCMITNYSNFNLDIVPTTTDISTITSTARTKTTTLTTTATATTSTPAPTEMTTTRSRIGRTSLSTMKSDSEGAGTKSDSGINIYVIIIAILCLIIICSLIIIVYCGLFVNKVAIFGMIDTVSSIGSRRSRRSSRSKRSSFSNSMSIENNNNDGNKQDRCGLSKSQLASRSISLSRAQSGICSFKSRSNIGQLSLPSASASVGDQSVRSSESIHSRHSLHSPHSVHSIHSIHSVSPSMVNNSSIVHDGNNNKNSNNNNDKNNRDSLDNNSNCKYKCDSINCNLSEKEGISEKHGYKYNATDSYIAAVNIAVKQSVNQLLDDPLDDPLDNPLDELKIEIVDYKKSKCRKNKSNHNDDNNKNEQNCGDYNDDKDGKDGSDDEKDSLNSEDLYTPLVGMEKDETPGPAYDVGVKKPDRKVKRRVANRTPVKKRQTPNGTPNRTPHRTPRIASQRTPVQERCIYGHSGDDKIECNYNDLNFQNAKFDKIKFVTT